MTARDLARTGFQRSCDGVLWVARRRAVPVDERIARRSCLVLAPHPDDETLGAGALISQRGRAGARVQILVATDGRNSFASTVLSPDELAAVRHDEVLAAVDALGLEPASVSFLGLEDGSLADRTAELEAGIEEAILRARPEDLVIPLPIDGHPDHRALAQAARSAARRAGHTGRVLGYPVWLAKVDAWTGGGGGSGVVPTVASRLADVLVRLPAELVTDPRAAVDKRAAVACHRSQTTNLTGEPHWPMLATSDLRRFVRDDELHFVLTDDASGG